MSSLSYSVGVYKNGQVGLIISAYIHVERAVNLRSHTGQEITVRKLFAFTAAF